MKIRTAERPDIDALAKLARTTYVDAFGHSFSPDELADILNRTRSVAFYKQAFDRDSILVAEERDELVGYVQFGAVTFDFDGVTIQDQELQRLYVLAGHQGRGIGKALLEAALAHERLGMALNVYLDVWEKNLGAQKLYTSFGFERVGRIDGDLVMARRQR